MRNPLALLLAGIMLLSPVMNVTAQHAGAACVVDAVKLPPELAGWCARQAIAAATNAKSLEAASVELGQAYEANLNSTTQIRYVTRPEKPGGSASFGGLFAFKVTEPGTYRVALSSGAWIDLLKDGKAVTSTAHGHGPDGSGIRKMVDFPLSPGGYTLQLAANGEAALTLMIVRVP